MRHQSLVGQPFSALKAALAKHRVYKLDYPLPGGTVTPDEVSARLRTSVDEDVIIRSVAWG